MERKGYLHSVEERSGRQTRRLYRATDLGKTMLEDAREKSVSCLVNCLKSKFQVNSPVAPVDLTQHQVIPSQDTGLR